MQKIGLIILACLLVYTSWMAKETSKGLKELQARVLDIQWMTTQKMFVGVEEFDADTVNNKNNNWLDD